MSFSPTPLRISTITALCNIGCEVPLDIVYKSLEINGKIQYLQFKDFPHKGIPKKVKRKPSTKSFYNQLTLVLRLSESRSINVKIFKNGQLQMTGVKSTKEGHTAVEVLIEELRRVMPKSFTFRKHGYRTVLINSDFCIGYKVNRKKLYLLLDQHYGLYVSYEPCIYPGVNAKYFWNSHNHSKDGVCACSAERRCNGKGDGSEIGKCKKVTIATFQSGTVIITGANTEEQLKDAHAFICSIFKKHEEHVKKKVLPPPMPVVTYCLSKK